MRGPLQVVLLAGFLLAGPVAAQAALDGIGGAGEAEPFIVTFSRQPTVLERADLASQGIVLEPFLTFPGAHGFLTPADRGRLARSPFVERLDPDAPVVAHLDYAKPLSRGGRPAWDLGVTGRGVTVAVVDSGIDATHPDLDGRVVRNVRYVAGAWQDSPGDTDGHGTHVAGIVAGSGAASGGAFAGLAPGARVVGLDFSDAFTTTAAIEAFDWIHEHHRQYGIRIVTNSWGRVDGGTRGFSDTDPVARSVDRLVRDGILVVFSAGNKGPGGRTLSMEAMDPDVLTVGGTDDAGVLGPYSSRGPPVDPVGRDLPWVKPDVVAAGTAVTSARSSMATGTPSTDRIISQAELPSDVGERYMELTGTSQAAPVVAGIAALLIEASPSLSPADLRNILRESAVDLGDPGPDMAFGFGLVDAVDALRLAQGLPEDGGNPILAGGVETYAAEGRVVASERAVVQLEPSPRTQKGDVVTFDFPVKPGASAVTFDFRFRPASAAFRVYLHDGLKTYGPWTTAETVAGDRVVSGLQAEGVAPGVWRLIARPGGAADVSYEADVEVRLAAAGLPADLPDRYRAAEEGTSPWDDAWFDVRYELDLFRLRVGHLLKERGVTEPAALLGYVAAGVAAVLLAAAFTRR